MLLNKETYIKTACELIRVDKFRTYLNIANVVVSLIILLSAVTLYCGFYRDSKPLI